MTDTPHILPNEPVRFGAPHLDLLLAHCETLKASDITIQTGHIFLLKSMVACYA